MVSFLIASLISLVLIVACVSVFYEIMAHVWVNLPRLEGRPRLQILLTVIASFIGHTIAIWIFGIAFYLLVHHTGFGALSGDYGGDLLSFIYFSAVSYSSLGLGDIYPLGELRLLIGVVAILGLILIGWTITFTYLVTDKYLTHRLKRRADPKD